MLEFVSFSPSVINVVVLKSTYDSKSSQYLYLLTNIGLIAMRRFLLDALAYYLAAAAAAARQYKYQKLKLNCIISYALFNKGVLRCN